MHFRSLKNHITSFLFRYSGEEWWHEEANVQKFKGVQGKTGTYLLRLTDWSSHGILDSATTHDTLGRKIHTFCENSTNITFREAPTLNWRKFNSQSDVYPVSSVQGLKKKLKTDKDFEQKWKLLFLDDENHELQNPLKYTSATLKQRRRETRELGRMSQTHEFTRQNEVKKSRRQRTPSFKASGHSKKHQSSLKRTETHTRQLDPDKSEVQKTKTEDNGTWRRIRKPDYCNFLPDAAFLNRNDYHTRLSLRGTRVFGRRNSRIFPNIESHICEGVPVTLPLKSKSISLPSNLQHTDSHDFEFWNTGFVQSRVRRLEEDLASKWEDRYNYWNCDFEVQSLCSLDFGRIMPDGDDYRIAYLSSMGTSLESSLDYMEDSISAFGVGTLDFRMDKRFPKEERMDKFGNGMETLDVKLTKKRIAPKNEDWDLSLSSIENKELSSDEDDEFEFSRISDVNNNDNLLTLSNYNSMNKVISKETENNNLEDFKSFSNDDSSNFPGLSGKHTEKSKGLNTIEKTHENPNKFEYQNSNLYFPKEKIKNHASNFKEEVMNFPTNSKNCIVPPKIWYEIRDPVDSKKLFRSKSNDSTHKSSKSNTWHKKMSRARTESSFFERNISSEEFCSLPIDMYSKMNELFSYEPLSTPFAEIYAIDCGKYTLKTSSESFEEIKKPQETNILARVDCSSIVDTQSKHKIYSEEQLDSFPHTTELECYASKNTYQINDANEQGPSQHKSKVVIVENDSNKKGESFYTSNSNLLSVKKNKPPLMFNLLEIDKINTGHAVESEFNHFSLEETSFRILPDHTSMTPANDKYYDHSNTFQALKENKLQVQRLESENNSSPIILIPSENAPFYSFFPSEEYLKRVTNKFLVSIDISKGLKNLNTMYSGYPCHLTNNETPIRQVDTLRETGNQNYPPQSDLHIETDVVNAGEIAESGSATSQTGRAAFVEYPFSLHSRVSECNLPCAGSVLHLTVPAAVLRLAKRESCSPSQRAAVVTLCSTTTAGAHQDLADQNSTCEIRIWHAIANPTIILDYVIDISAWRLDYNYGDYVPFGCLPEGLALLIISSVCNDFAGFRSIMATCDSDLRSLGKVVRIQGKNISKLMRLFDSNNERSVSYSCENTSLKSSDIKEKSNYVSTQSVTEIQHSNDYENFAALFSRAHDDGSSMKDSQSSTLSANTGKVNDCVMDSEQLCNGKSVSSDIPYCRKVSNGGLWENVNICAKSDSDGLWNDKQNNNQSTDLDQASNSLVTSTAELNNLIASSRAELSKKKEPSVSDKSNLENYFTSFENSRPGRSKQLNNIEKSFSSNEYNNTEIFHPYLTSHYSCDMNEINFEDEEAVLSDTSSEEDLKCHPAMNNTNYLPAYALHTIIEESCEESERDSRTTTPTNDAVASKLERYFSWDIINDTDRDLRGKVDDESTIYSDSLSESSNSLAGEDAKDIDPTHLASSRLEKYFTSGLVDDQNCFYPDDAEFLDDAPVSDFDEDNIHQKISRSALLSSLETKPIIHQVNIHSNSQEFSNAPFRLHDMQDYDESPVVVSETGVNNDAKLDDCDNRNEVSTVVHPPENTQSLEKSTETSEEVSLSLEKVEQPCLPEQNVYVLEDNCGQIPLVNNGEEVSEFGAVAPIEETTEKGSEEFDKDTESCSPKPTVNRDQLATDIQAIIKKLLSYFTTETESFKKNVETNYVSAWHILETEIERLLQSISPNSVENNSCNSSTIDSNNSDYGSDTIESMDCITDDDDIDAKNRMDGKCPIVDILNSAYKFQTQNSDLSSFNISEETLSIWKRLIQSLQKDNSVLSENKLCDPNAEARLYIRDQIVTLMHTVTVNDNLPEIEKLPPIYQNQNREISPSSLEASDYPDQINEAFNVNIGNASILTCLNEQSVSKEADTLVKAESCDEGISDDSTDNAVVLSEKPTVESVCNQANSDIVLVTASSNIELCEEAVISPELVCFENDTERALGNLSSESQPESEDTETTYRYRNKHNFSNKELSKKDSDMKFSVIVDIELNDDSRTEQNSLEFTENITCDPPESFQTSDTTTQDDKIDSTLPNQSKNETDSPIIPFRGNIKDSIRSHKRVNPEGTSSRDTGYYSFKSSDDSLLNTSSQSAEFVDVPNFKSLKRTVKKFPVSNTLSKSTNNILQSFSSSPDAKFSTLQLKTKKSKNSNNVTNSSRQFSSLFSPSAVLKRFTGSKNNENPESSIPPKYLKKYARSISVDNDSLFGAVSMPQLNSPRGQGDSYSALGLYAENDRDSSLIVDDDTDVKRYFSGSQSALSLGAHSASMTSVYSGAGCHYGFVTVSGDVLFGLNYNQKSQMMEVFIKECRNLAAIDVRHNKSNPYVKVYLLPDKTRSGKRKTKTKKNTVNPVFNELLRFPVLKNELESRTLWLSVWNSDLFGRNDFLGEISLPLGYRLLDSPTLRWYPLQDRVGSLQSPLHCKGELFIALKYVPRDLSLESRFRPAPVISLRGALHVLVKEARNISAQRGSMDAFCKSYLLPDKSKTAKQKTPVVKKSNHPKWYYTVIYEDLSVEELRERSLELTVWDHDKIARNNFVGGVRLNVGTGLYHGVPVDWMDSRRDESGLWLSMLDSPNMWVDGCLPLRPTMHTQGAGIYTS
ncbi:synaptotagmin-like protein 4 [Trichonephila clavata]|uniref:Synaptotagmin-like protein 4 n=1 Tax=Trichonephila clavata TaxID=2740835 RepID=A0A8X6K686_TRICU|nr:synaptotagmin-like protein 4 [Trichonephila clavata]